MRLAELFRISKKKCFWMIGNKVKYKGLKRSKYYEKYIKKTDIKVLRWKGSGWCPLVKKEVTYKKGFESRI